MVVIGSRDFFLNVEARRGCGFYFGRGSRAVGLMLLQMSLKLVLGMCVCLSLCKLIDGNVWGLAGFGGST